MTNENVGNGSGYKMKKKKGGDDVMMLGQTWDIDYGSKMESKKTYFRARVSSIHYERKIGLIEREATSE